METNNSTRVGEHFDKNWMLYQQSVQNNLLYHNEMFSTLDGFLNNHFRNMPFTLADLGCGDGSAIANVLANKPITRYIGVDAATNLISEAHHVLANLACEKQFVCEDMAIAIKKLIDPINIIFSSYTLHHFSHENKINFIKNCQDKLGKNGYFLLIDGVLAENQNRNQWLDALENRFFECNPGVTKEAGLEFLKHPRADDFPESINTFRHIAEIQQWKNFQVLVDKGIFAFMVFTK